jgi:hypothetical protein
LSSSATNNDPLAPLRLTPVGSLDHGRVVPPLEADGTPVKLETKRLVPAYRGISSTSESLMIS